MRPFEAGGIRVRGRGGSPNRARAIGVNRPYLNKFVNQAEQSAGEHDRDDVDPVTKHCDKSRCAERDRKPVDNSGARKENVEPKPNSEVQDHANDRSSYGREGAGEFLVSPQLLNVRAADKDPKKTRSERCPGCE